MSFGRYLTVLLCMVALGTAPAFADSSEAADKSPVEFVFIHKYNHIFDTRMGIGKFESLYRMMPKKLKREIGNVYYPALHDSLQVAEHTAFMEAEASKLVLADGSLRIELSFPKFFLTMNHITWEDLDRLFLTYFK